MTSDELPVIHHYEGDLELDPREVFLEALVQYSTSELLKHINVRQVDSLAGDKEAQNPSEEHTIYVERFSIMGPMLHVVLYRTEKDKKQNGKYSSARYGILDEERMVYLKLSIDALIDWLVERAPDALETTVREVYEGILRQQVQPREHS